MPTISVVIPTYNRQRFIREAIRSVLYQTRSPAEIIICDDGSTDGTEEVVMSMASTVPVVYKRQENQGPGAARNLGAASARGDWIAFLDDDDVWHPEKLAAQEDYVAAHPEVVFVYSHFEFIDEASHPMPMPTKWDELGLMIFDGNPPALPSTVLVKKDVFLEIGGFDVRLKHAEDWDLFVRIAERFPTHCVEQKLVKHRRHGAQIHGDSRLIDQSWPAVHEMLCALWRDNPRKRAVLFRKTAQIYSSLGKQYLIDGDYIRARISYKKALRYQPWSWKTMRRWGLSYVPILREWYRRRKLDQRGNASLRNCFCQMSGGCDSGKSPGRAESFPDRQNQV